MSFCARFFFLSVQCTHACALSHNCKMRFFHSSFVKISSRSQENLMLVSKYWIHRIITAYRDTYLSMYHMKHIPTSLNVWFSVFTILICQKISLKGNLTVNIFDISSNCNEKQSMSLLQNVIDFFTRREKTSCDHKRTKDAHTKQRNHSLSEFFLCSELLAILNCVKKWWDDLSSCHCLYSKRMSCTNEP